MQDEVLDFINRRWKKYDANWMNGNCYWFAFILCERFPSLEMIFLPIEGHFVAGNIKEGRYYDWTGKVDLQEDPYSFNSLRLEEPNLYSHLLRDCRN